jgi:histone deacetylase 6
MFSAASASDAAGAALASFLGSRPGLVLKAAPAAAAAGAEAVSGILVTRFTAAKGSMEEDEGEWLEDDDEEEGEEGGGASKAFLEEKDDVPSSLSRLSLDAGSVVSAGAGSVPHSHRDMEHDDDEPDLAGVEEEDEDELAVLGRIVSRASALTAERDSLAAINSDLQRKAAALIAREKALLQGQTRAGTSADEPPAKEEDAPKEEHLQEKEKQFTEILGHILEGRKKASQQQLEYDQLALDLQTRLDDREFKAGEIYESFKAFKKEILLKAENSRTSKPMSKRLIAQFEAAELKREEDLERVRLRNISMRTQLKKMEKTQRAREQLAEGLYMIDFEQLKVENQTLYEKIEERSEEVVKLKRKKTVTVQTLTHVREKLRFIESVRPPPFFPPSVKPTPFSPPLSLFLPIPTTHTTRGEQSNVQLNRELCEVENHTMSRRGELTTTKKQRDVVRDDNKELRLKQGFSSSTGLITDYESRKSKLDDVKAEIAELKARYEMLSRQAGVGLDSSKK